MSIIVENYNGGVFALCYFAVLWGCCCVGFVFFCTTEEKKYMYELRKEFLGGDGMGNYMVVGTISLTRFWLRLYEIHVYCRMAHR